MGYKISGLLEVDSLEIPFLATSEYRKSIRYSVGKRKVNIKLPIYYTKPMIQKELKKVELWLHKEMLKNEKLKLRFTPTVYVPQKEIIVLGDKYDISIKNSSFNSSRINLTSKNSILIQFQYDLPDNLKHQTSQKLLSKLMAKMYKPTITKMVYAINNQYFGEEINSVNLKYNKSNWGSCSSKKNINISTRLLLCPDIEVIQYVIIHELAHLKEMNHSPAFWSIVKNISPNYQLQEQWLKKYGYTLDF